MRAKKGARLVSCFFVRIIRGRHPMDTSSRNLAVVEGHLASAGRGNQAQRKFPRFSHFSFFQSSEIWFCRHFCSSTFQEDREEIIRDVPDICTLSRKLSSKSRNINFPRNENQRTFSTYLPLVSEFVVRGAEMVFQLRKKDAPGLLWMPTQQAMKENRSSGAPTLSKMDFAKKATILFFVAYLSRLSPTFVVRKYNN